MLNMTPGLFGKEYTRALIFLVKSCGRYYTAGGHLDAEASAFIRGPYKCFPKISQHGSYVQVRPLGWKSYVTRPAQKHDASYILVYSPRLLESPSFLRDPLDIMDGLALPIRTQIAEAFWGWA